MWCDEHEVDLLRLLPEAQEIIGDLANIELFTHGGMTDGTIDHAMTWNTGAGATAYYGFFHPANPESCRATKGVVSCSFLEAVRDAWCCQYALCVEGTVVWNAQTRIQDYSILFLYGRGRMPVYELAAQARERIAESLRQAMEVMRGLSEHPHCRRSAAHVAMRPAADPLMLTLKTLRQQANQLVSAISLLSTTMHQGDPERSWKCMEKLLGIANDMRNRLYAAAPTNNVPEGAPRGGIR